ncbi:MAG: DUF86 domain-containing protein [Patescibacteria group bacterium]
MRETRVYLEDILESIKRIERYIKDLKTADFIENEVVQDGVMKRMEVIGEAVKHLPDNIKNKYPEIPWKNIAGIRDVLIHEYAGVQLETIWRTAKNDLPTLKQTIVQLLNGKKS